MGEVVNIRDFKRKEEQDAALVRLAREVMGLDLGDGVHCILDTAPSEYVAPEDVG